MNILLLGDIVSQPKFKSSIDIDASLLLLNLEAPIIKKKVPAIKKAGPHLSSREFVLPVNSGSTIVANLANNHIMDYGSEGLRDTLTECNEKNILVVGAGENLDEARLPLIIEINNKKIGIIGCCEIQFGISTPWKSGVASLGPWIYSAIRDLKNRVDLIIISIHGALEDFPLPSPEWQELLRSFVDEGANIIHGHHSHVPQGFEEYNGGIIFYGLGNCVVDPKKWKNRANTLWSIIPEINIANDNLEYHINTSVILECGDNSTSVRKSNSDEFVNHMKYLEMCNKPLNDKKLLTALWQEVSIRMYYLYYAKYLNFPEGNQKLGIKKCVKSFLVRIRVGIEGKSVFFKKSTQNELLLWYVLFACENHRHSIATTLGVLSGEIEYMCTDEIRALADEMIPELCDWQKDMV